MPIIKIRNHEVDVDIESELAEYDWGYNAKWTHDKLIAASPFRDDSTPSFFVNLDGEYAGTFGDSGAYDDKYKSGNFTKLLAYLRAESHEETERYLLDSYGILYEDAEDIRLPEIRLIQRSPTVEIPSETVTEAISPYLTRRGISTDVQRMYRVGYNEAHKGFTAIPWYTTDGRLANVKYRSTSDKRFFYEKGATPIRTLVYGLDVVNARREDTAVICEGEIDVMTWRTAGIAAIGIGGSSISDEQIDAIKRSSIKRLGLGGDNDAAGQSLNEQVRRELEGYVELYSIDYESLNDANEVLKTHGIEGLQKLVNFTVSKLRDNYLQICNITVI